MAIDTTTTLSKLLKNVYEPGVKTQFNEEVVLYNLATKKSRPFRGGKEYFGINMDRQHGVGARGETQGLPTPVGPTPEQANVTLSRLFQVSQISHDTMELSKSDQGAFKDALTYLVEGGYSRTKKLANIYAFGAGDAILATVPSGTADVTIATTATGTLTLDTTRYLTSGDLISMWTSNGDTSTVLANGGQDAASNELVSIVSITDATRAVIKNGGPNPVTVAAANAMRLFGDKPTSGVAGNNALTGLQTFADDGTNFATFEGLSRTTYDNWKGQYIDHANQNLTRDVLYRLNDKIVRRGGEAPDCAIMDPSLLREYLNLLQPDTRFQPVSGYDAGYSGTLTLSLGPKKLNMFTDIDCPFGQVFMFAKGVLDWFELTPLELDASTGSALKQATPFGSGSTTGDSFYFYMRMKGNMATNKPACFGRIVNINYTAE